MTRFDQTLHEVQYELTIPSHDRAQVERDIKVIPVVPPHEALQREVRDRPTLRDKLAELVRDKTLPDDYFCHPVVRQHELGRVFPLQLFVDGVPTTKKDNMIGFHVVNVVSGARHIVACLRKSRLCACGCHGWCSLYQVFDFLQWSFSAAASGRVPSGKHDGRPWLPSDALRSAGGASEGVVAACLLHIKGDWMELVTSFGFPSWSDKAQPCWACACSHEQLHQLSGANVLQWPFPLKDTPEMRAQRAYPDAEGVEPAGRYP